jgi:RNA polymerase sigma-70 factor (ECF subfamily)
MSLEPAIQDALLAAMPRLRAFAVSLCRDRDHADDLVQDTLLRACAKIEYFRPGTNMLAWLITILRNRFCSEWRSQRRLENLDAHIETLAAKPTQLSQLQYREFCQALDKLPSSQRAALLLVEAWGLSYDEAAQISGCPIGTVKSRINRGRAYLAQLLRVESRGQFEDDSVFSAAMTNPGAAARGA